MEPTRQLKNTKKIIQEGVWNLTSEHKTTPDAKGGRGEGVGSDAWATPPFSWVTSG